MSVLNKAKLLSTLSDSIRERFSDVKSEASRQMQIELGSSVYSYYTSLPTDHERLLPDGNVDPLFKEYDELTEDEQMRRNLETAEAYLCLYHLVPILKRLNADSVLSNKETAGSGYIALSEIDELDKMRNIYLGKARSYIAQYSNTGGISVIVI